jgi:dihydrolipoamide dehydrogenase
LKNYDIVIIGAGPGGYVAAIRARHLGASVAIIEKQDIGGVCLNIGCIPTKALIKSAKVFKQFMHSEEYGIEVDKAAVKVNWPAVISRKDGVVKKLTGGVKTLLTKNGVDIYQGFGNVLSPTTIEVNGEKITTKNIILATGATPVIPPIPGVKEAYEKGIILTSKEALSLPELPKQLVIIGGGVIGIEFATIFSQFNVEVTIIEMADSILVNVDEEVRNTYLRLLKKDKVNVITSAAVTKVDNNNVTYNLEGKDVTIKAEKILMSVGMRPNVPTFENVKIETTRQGITVNDRLETSIKGIYAIGDVNGKVMLAHAASAQGIAAVNNIMGKTDIVKFDRIPAGIYGFPEIAMVGITEQAAKSQKLDYAVSKFPLAGNGKALAEGEAEGFVKIIADKKYGEILGVHILAANATELIGEIVTTMELEGTAYELANAVHPHPTISEAIMEAAQGIIGKAIHRL